MYSCTRRCRCFQLVRSESTEVYYYIYSELNLNVIINTIGLSFSIASIYTMHYLSSENCGWGFPGQQKFLQPLDYLLLPASSGLGGKSQWVQLKSHTASSTVNFLAFKKHLVVDLQENMRSIYSSRGVVDLQVEILCPMFCSIAFLVMW